MHTGSEQSLPVYHAGNELYKKGKYREALPFLLASSNEGLPSACLKAGLIYRNVAGLKNETKKAELFAKISSSSKWFHEHGAEDDDLLNLALSYDVGVFGPRDEEKAIKYFQQAADQGSSIAQNVIGYRSECGKGLPKDLKKAISYYQLAADKGLATAEYNLGYCYQRSIGVKRNVEMATKYLVRAANQDHENAMINLAFCHENGDGAEKSSEKAFHWFKMAADRGHPAAISHLGISYRLGRGVEKNLKMAIECLQKSWKQEYNQDTITHLQEALFDLGCGYFEGREGYVVNVSVGMKYFQLCYDYGGRVHDALPDSYPFGARIACEEMSQTCLLILSHKPNLLPEIWLTITLTLLSLVHIQ